MTEADRGEIRGHELLARGGHLGTNGDGSQTQPEDHAHLARHERRPGRRGRGGGSGGRGRRSGGRGGGAGAGGRGAAGDEEWPRYGHWWEMDKLFILGLSAHAFYCLLLVHSTTNHKLSKTNKALSVL